MSGGNDWGVPDWLNALQYPKHTTGVAWAWEFLRRNAEYRTFWTARVLPFVAPDGSIGDDETGCSAGFAEAENRFGLLAGPRDCRSSSTAWLLIDGNAIRRITGSLSNSEVSISREEAAFVFDLSFPLEPQFRNALRSAKALQAHRRRTGEAANRDARLRPEKYVLYLRLIDGEDAGAKAAQIKDELFGNISEEYPSNARSTAFKNTRAAAHRLRDGGYRSLAAT
jgi:hypothetical protein